MLYCDTPTADKVRASDALIMRVYEEVEMDASYSCLFDHSHWFRLWNKSSICHFAPFVVASRSSLQSLMPSWLITLLCSCSVTSSVESPICDLNLSEKPSCRRGTFVSVDLAVKEYTRAEDIGPMGLHYFRWIENASKGVTKQRSLFHKTTKSHEKIRIPDPRSWIRHWSVSPYWIVLKGVSLYWLVLKGY